MHPIRGEAMPTYSDDDLSRSSDSACAYPTADGRPLGETDFHRAVIFYLIEVLQRHFARERTYVSGNILLFYRPGDRRRHVAPDVLVVRDLDPHPRENFLLWEEERSPQVVIEVTSKSTRREDLREKFALYRDEIRVAEYFLFDPLGDYLEPRLQGFRLRDGQYVPIAMVDGRLPSAELGLSFEPTGDELSVYDPARQRWLPTGAELAMEEKARREAAEEQSRRDREELDRLRRQLAELRGSADDGRPL